MRIKSPACLKASRSVRDSADPCLPRPPECSLSSAVLSVFRASFPPRETNSSLLQINDDKDCIKSPPPPGPRPVSMKTGRPRGQEEGPERDEHVLRGVMCFLPPRVRGWEERRRGASGMQGCELRLRQRISLPCDPRGLPSALGV